MKVVEASIEKLRDALQAGDTTSVGLVAAYLNRIAHYDRHGITLNAVPVLNPDMFTEARASDLRRARGESLGPLDGIPYAAKDSYKVKGLSVASGSPAFADLIATEDAFAISRLRAAGAVLIGLTNMPPMANGGMQRGVYGRAESPYNADWLTAAFGSGSSNGSGTATAASLAAFGLGEETWSSGRAPAANNGLCAYTPSRGVISVRGNWPLVPTMDVVVPHSRSMADMLELLDIIVADDPDTRGDLWRRQTWISIPKASASRPQSYVGVAATASLAGKRFALPAMYINADPEAGTGENVGIGGPTGQRIETRASMIALCAAAREALEAAGAEVVITDFPVVSNYEGDRPGAPTIATRGLVDADYLHREIVDLSAWAWDDFLATNADPTLHRLADVDGKRIFPAPGGSLPDRYHGFDDRIAEYPARLRDQPIASFHDIPGLADGLRGLEETRRIDLESWMDRLGLDAVIFPAVADIGPADADMNPVSADLAWRNGTWVANGNLAIRHLGIPTVTVPMGMLADIGMPAGLTFAGRAWDDTALLAYACAFEQTGTYRQPPTRTPELPDLSDRTGTNRPDATDPVMNLSIAPDGHGGQRLSIQVQSQSRLLWLTVNGAPVVFQQEGTQIDASLDMEDNTHVHSEWRNPYGHIVIACAEGAAAYAIVGGTA
ncbi:amidase [Shinella sp. CPCC 101442]|uniref:amidase n=1 Tax=Shinella sp. CPCC 101442 TaxID=2932265 RepID=UPI0021529299|nr:amidase [Shinella sp. CPCC 101442]MCR6498264.1 amidase [Shinella sp. CPCC 101442]